MRPALLIPILILAGLGVFAFATREQPTAPAQEYITGTTPGVVAVQAYLLPAAQAGYLPIRDTTVADPVLDANAALLYHLETGQYLYERNTDTKVPIASLTKLLSALVAQDLFDQQEVIAIASGSVRVDGYKQTLYEGERILVRDLVSMMLVESSNDAAYALAAYAHERGVDFIAEMNSRAFTIGMQNCRFTDPAGLDDNAYCTARDLLRLVRATLRQAPGLWPVMTQSVLTIRSSDSKITHQVKSTNELLGQVDGIIGGKTGHTDGALGCMVLVVKLPGKDDTLVSIVLGSRARFGDTKALLSWAQTGWNWQ